MDSLEQLLGNDGFQPGVQNIQDAFDEVTGFIRPFEHLAHLRYPLSGSGLKANLLRPGLAILSAPLG